MKSYLSNRKIKVKVEMMPEQINHQWKLYLFSQLCQKYQGKCTRDDGYIVQVKKILKIYDQYVTIHGKILFFLEILTECILPKIGDCIDVTIDMIFSHGVFCHHKMLRMMMPFVKCKPLQFRQEFSTNSLFHPYTKQIMRKGDVMRVLIDDVRFENDFYSCIVSFQIENDLKT